MADVASRLDLYAIARDYIQTRAQKIDPAQVDIEGSDANIFAGISAVLGYAVMQQVAYRTGALLLDSADGEDLDRLAFDRYNLTRKGASPALGTIIITRATTVAGAGTVPSGTKVSSNTGSEYILATSASFGIGDLQSTADVRAVQAGKATQVGANAIVRFTQPGTLFDRTLVCINPNPTAGGEDAEDDETFRSRIRDFWRTARRGILAAIEFGALAVPGVVSAQAVETLGFGGFAARLVNLYIADSSGVASTALAALVKTALDDYRAAGIQVLVSTSLPLLVDMELQLTFRAGVDTLSLTDTIKAALVEFVNSLAVNGALYKSQLFSVLQRYADDGLIVDEGTLIAPTGDLVPSAGQTLRTTLANITVA